MTWMYDAERLVSAPPSPEAKKHRSKPHRRLARVDTFCWQTWVVKSEAEITSDCSNIGVGYPNEDAIKGAMSETSRCRT
jgi:hypothetical protein